jgi:hypothetical protein
MPDLSQALQGHDLGFLKIVAGAWGVELTAPDAATALPILSRALLERPLVQEVLETLPPEARQALQALMEHDGQLSWSYFCRRFGELRPMGPGKRDRERPDLKPISTTEILWYHALIGKAFLNLPPEPQEFAYIPEDLIEFLHPITADVIAPLGRPASPIECAHPITASDRILDHSCTLLAALRMGSDLASIGSAWEMSPATLKDILYTAGMVDMNNIPVPEATRAFLEASRGDALLLLAQSWTESYDFNDLRHLPGLIFEGEWRNDALQVRKTVMGMLSQLPEESWWSLPAFIAAVHDRHPDFQRPAGDYDSWYIRRENSETYLRGYGSWDEVDGALLRYLITGPLHWLGFLDLAASEPGQAPTAFRASKWAPALWINTAPAGLPVEDRPIRANSDGRLILSNLTPRSVRYQTARFCLWEAENAAGPAGEYRYQLSPASLERAQQQGLKLQHLTSLLRRSAQTPLPPDLLQALDRWEKYGNQTRLERALLLRVSSPEVLAALRKTRASRFLGEALNATTVTIKPGGENAVRNALAECGYLSDSAQEV